MDPRVKSRALLAFTIPGEYLISLAVRNLARDSVSTYFGHVWAVFTLTIRQPPLPLIVTPFDLDDW